MVECSCEDIKKIIKEIVNEAFQQKMIEMKTKRKRAPSKYNLFIKSCLKEKETTGPIQERFKKCTALYKKQ
jgi:hypothetical protein